MKYIAALVGFVAAAASGEFCTAEDAKCDEGLCCGTAIYEVPDTNGETK